MQPYDPYPPDPSQTRPSGGPQEGTPPPYPTQSGQYPPPQTVQAPPSAPYPPYPQPGQPPAYPYPNSAPPYSQPYPPQPGSYPTGQPPYSQPYPPQPGSYPTGQPPYSQPYGQPSMPYSPSPGFAPPPGRNNTGLIVALSVIGGIIVLSLVILLGVNLAEASSSSNSIAGTATNTPGISATNTPIVSTGGAQRYKVGDTVKLGTWQVTVNSAKTSAGDDFSKPKAGYTFLIVDVTLVNNDSQTQPASSFLFFSIKDSTGQQYEETFLSGNTPPDGNVAAGDKLRGQLVYEVPQSQHQFTLTFQPDFLTNTIALFTITD